MKTRNKYYRLNYQIQAAKIRLLDENGKQIGIKDKVEALKLAQSQSKDLVEIAPNAKPPVVKLIDFKKFKYLEAKKEKEARKSVKNVGVKEIRLSPFMQDHDFNTRVKQGESFLKAGNQLKISLPFKGRAIVHKQFGMTIMEKAIKRLEESARINKPPHFEGRVLVAMLVSAKKQSTK